MIGFWWEPSSALQAAVWLCPHVGERTVELSLVPFIRALIPFVGVLLDPSSRAQHTVKPKKTPKCWRLDQRKFYCRAERGDQVDHAQKT